MSTFHAHPETVSANACRALDEAADSMLRTTPIDALFVKPHCSAVALMRRAKGQGRTVCQTALEYRLADWGLDKTARIYAVARYLDRECAGIARRLEESAEPICQREEV